MPDTVGGLTFSISERSTVLAYPLSWRFPSLPWALAYGFLGLHGSGQLWYRSGRRCGLQVRARLGCLACLGDGDATTVSFWEAWNRFGPLSTRNGKEVSGTEGVCGPLLARG